jgi:hypothetical protein
MKKNKSQRTRPLKREKENHSSAQMSKVSAGQQVENLSDGEERELEHFLSLQQTIGNRAVQRALAQPAGKLEGLSRQALMRQKAAAPAEKAKEKEKEETGTPSGAGWVKEFPTSKEVSDLDSSFAGKVQNFIAALQAAGATVTINATKRPLERAFLMHWAWMIAKKGYDPRKVPAMKGVEINWWHGDLKSSKDAAQEMVDGYGINKLKVPPSLTSHHITGKAIDMEISWSGDLVIKNAKGAAILIKTSPKNQTNRALIAVGRTYQVIHYIEVAKDKVHWSVDGH